MLRKIIIMGCLAGMCASVSASPWEKFKTPTQGEAQSIGSYANGCLAGGEELPLEGEGYQVIRSNRHRYYGNPELIEFLQQLTHASNQLKIGNVLIGDIAMARGGRFSSGHASHQTGLDADIWLKITDKPLAKNQLQTVSALPMVNLEQYKINKDNWTEKQAQLIQLAASDERVARIFVHPVIKETLCKEEWKDRSWLRKVRPWWGHYYHFHVRLNCPEGSQYCQAQTPPPPGDGCGAELASWRPKPVDKTKPTVKPKPKPKPVMPAQCKALLKG